MMEKQDFKSKLKYSSKLLTPYTSGSLVPYEGWHNKYKPPGCFMLDKDFLHYLIN